MSLSLIAMDITKFQSSEKLHIFVMYWILWFENNVWFTSFVSFQLCNKCIDKNIVVLDNEITNFKMGSKAWKKPKYITLFDIFLV